jgi:lipoprotein-anchoring transpeptidase ErfK/SrfK
MGKKRIRVNLSRQVLFAYDGKEEVYQFDCVTGDSDHPTGVGVFKIFRKHEKYVSKKYGSRMDYAMFFTQDGKAIHQAYMVGPMSLLKAGGMDWFGSHGCVRLSESNAKTLFEWAPMHTTVEIVSGESKES